MVFIRDQFKNSTSLIIGCISTDINNLQTLLENLGDNNFFIKEIIIIFNDIKNKSEKELIKTIQKENNRYSIYIDKERLFPGQARNVGLEKSDGKFVAFLDASTIPEDLWLEKSFKTILNNNANGILGNTKFLHKNSFEKSFIAATYGEKNLRTVPGSLFRRKFIKKVGYFLPNLRSGEDKEWTNRCMQLEKKIYVENQSQIFYRGIIGKKFIRLCRKWFENYSNSAQDYSIEFERQRFIYITFFCLLIIIIARFWNNVVASWDQSSIFYIPNITKISLSILIIFYFAMRFIILPKRKNIKFRNYKLLEIINFIYIGLILDIIKLIAFIKTILKSLKIIK